jgi:hypothetical protein
MSGRIPAELVDGRTVRARVIEQLVVALHARPRHVLPDDVFGERRRGEQAPQELQSADNRALIGVLGKVAWVSTRTRRLDRIPTNDRLRRVLVVAARFGEGPFMKLTTAAQP